MSVGKIDRMSEDEEDIDVSIIPMEHRTKHGLMSPMTRHVLKKSNFRIKMSNNGFSDLILSFLIIGIRVTIEST